WTKALLQGPIGRVGMPLLFFTLTTLVMTFPMGFHLEDSVLHPADPILNTWILAWNAHILPRDPLKLYHANHFYPYSNTLAYSETLLGQTILAAPIIWITRNPILAANLVWLTTFVLSGLTMYALVYHFTRRWEAALLAGTIFAFHPFRFAHLFHLQVLSIHWFPLILLFLDRLLRKGQWKDAIGLTLTFNLQVLSCYYYAFFTAIGVAVLLIGYGLWLRNRINRRAFLLLLLFLIVTAIIQIPLSIPYFVVSRSMGFQRSIEDAIRGGADLTDFITATPANWLYGDLTSPLREEGWWEHITFPGLTAFLLAIGGTIWGLTKKNLRAIIVLCLLFSGVMFSLSLGPALRIKEQNFLFPLPYKLLFEYVPGFQAIRQPARAHALTMTGISVLAGVGVLGVRTLLREHRWKQGIGVLFATAVLVENLEIPLPYVRVPLADNLPPVYKWLAQQDGEPVLELPILMDVGATESPRLYYSTFHWKRLVNGYGGFFPPAYAYFLFFDREFPHQPYRWIVGLGIRYVILHRWQYDFQELARINHHMADFQNRLRLVADFGEDQVFEVIHPITGQPNRPFSDCSLGGKAVLLGYFAESPVVSAGSVLEVTLFWQARAQMETDYMVFVHIMDSESHLVAQHDGPPAGGERPTSAWKYDEVVIDAHKIPLPAHLLPGTYEIRTGMYNLQTMERLPVLESDGTICDRDFLRLGQIQIQD
ncbi:MAG: hypothetical protein ACPLYD_14280, partial [Anaerolineae bacterium]